MTFSRAHEGHLVPVGRAGAAFICLAALVAVVGASGCLRARAKTVSDLPPLSTPPAPPRVIETVEAAVPPPVPLIEELPRQPIRPPVRQPPRVEAQPRQPEPPRSEAPEPPPAAEPSKPPATLQTTPAVAEAEVERAIRGVLARANSDLNRVNVRRLSGDARSQMETARRFIQLSEQALRPPRNLEFARSLADKAAVLAAQLAAQ